MNKQVFFGFILLFILLFYGFGQAQEKVIMDIRNQHHSDVILYATSWCGYCSKTKDFLRKNNIHFVEYDIEKSTAGKEQFSRLNGDSVPLLIVKSELVHGYNPDAILQALEGP